MKILEASFEAFFEKFSLGPKSYDKKYGMKRYTAFFQCLKILIVHPFTRKQHPHNIHVKS